MSPVRLGQALKIIGAVMLVMSLSTLAIVIIAHTLLDV